MCVEGMVTPRQKRWRIGRAFCQRASPSPFSLEDPADTADSYACWTDENADEAAVGWTERVRQFPTFAPSPRKGEDRPQAAGRDHRRWTLTVDRIIIPSSLFGMPAWTSGLGCAASVSVNTRPRSGKVGSTRTFSLS